MDVKSEPIQHERQYWLDMGTASRGRESRCTYGVQTTEVEREREREKERKRRR